MFVYCVVPIKHSTNTGLSALEIMNLVCYETMKKLWCLEWMVAAKISICANTGLYCGFSTFAYVVVACEVCEVSGT